MSINRIITCITVATFAAACVEARVDELVDLQAHQLKATMGETLTKVSMNSDYSLYWEAGDKVSVFAPDEVNNVFTAASEGPTTVLDGPEGYVVDASVAYHAVYPYSEENSISDGVITTVIPYEQTPRTDSFPFNVSVAKSSSGKALAFYNVCGLMGFKITRSDIVKVSLKSHGAEEYMAGKISIDCSTLPQPGYTVLEGKTEVTLVKKGGFAAGDYYVAILPRKYTGMTITMYTADGQVGYVESRDEFTLHRSNHIKPLAVDTQTFEGSLLARWVYGKDNSESPFKTAWVTDNSVPADQGQGTFSYVTQEPVNNNFKRTVGTTGAPIVYGAWPGDYWLYEVPVAVTANTSYSINFAARVSDTGHKFWMLEYLDGSEWKPIGAVNSSDEPGSTVSYTHTMENADATVGGTFTVTNAMSALKIRYRCMANWKSEGGTLSARNGGTVRMSQANNATLDIWALDKMEVQATRQHAAAQWITSNSSWATDWTSNNRFYALSGDYKSKAYISTTASGPERYVYDSKHAAVKNLKVGDCIYFTVPSQTLSASARVSFMTNMMALSSPAVSDWVLEYKKDGTWTAAGEDNDFYIKYFSAYQYTTFTQSFTLGSALNNKDLEMRIRVTELSGGSSADVAFCKSSWQGVNIDIWDGLAVKDKKRVLVLGNSFSYYHATNFILHQLALSQGHDMKMYTHIKGSQTFANHMNLERSQDAISKGNFDYAFLQDQSQQHSNYYMDPTANRSILNDTKSIIEQIKQKSSAVCPILENTWSYSASSYNGFGSHEMFDKALYGGGLLISDAADCWLSPIGVAFQKARAAGIQDLYHSDDKHPGTNGSYLKACVNYLMIYGEAFTADAADNIIDPTTAAKLRKIAEEVVLADINKYRNPDSSDVVPGDIDSSGSTEGGIVAGENGIRTPDQLFSFAKVVNAGGDISSYCNSKGEVVLLGDIELPKTAWTPIGSASGIAEKPTTAPVPASAFNGVFDGNGYIITGLQLVVTDNTVTTCGFFGALSGATVRNVTFEDVVLSLNSSGVNANHLSVGTVAGYSYNSTIENVKVYAQYSGTVTSTASRNINVGGIAGSVAATEDGKSLVKNCLFDGTVTNDIATKYANTNSVSIGGIVGGTVYNGVANRIVGCTNDATINVKAHRAAGILAAASGGQVEDCVNNGNITVVHSASKHTSSVAGVRTGGIVAYNQITVTNVSHIKNCTNNGTITTTEASSAAGGVAGLVRLTHIEGCRNTGAVYCSDGFGALLVGRITSATDGAVTFADCYVSGKTGTSAANATAATAGNYLQLGVNFDGGSDVNWTSSNIHFGTGM